MRDEVFLGVGAKKQGYKRLSGVRTGGFFDFNGRIPT